MCLKSCEKYLIIASIAIILIFLGFCPIFPTTINNETMFTTYLGLTFHDGSIFVALLTGIGTILVTLYSIDKNYKTMKLSLLPENTANLLIDLEFAFNEYEDQFFLLTEILKYWKDNQKAFRLLTPKFYKEFLKIINKYSFDNTQNKNIDEKQGNYENINSDYILNALMAQITNIAFDKDECKFSFIKPELIKDDADIQKIGGDLENYNEIEFTKSALNNYIEDITGQNTKKLTVNKFNAISSEFEKLLNILKNEIKEYD